MTRLIGNTMLIFVELRLKHDIYSLFKFFLKKYLKFKIYLHQIIKEM